MDTEDARYRQLYKDATKLNDQRRQMIAELSPHIAAVRLAEQDVLAASASGDADALARFSTTHREKLAVVHKKLAAITGIWDQLRPIWDEIDTIRKANMQIIVVNAA